jgi:uncharacterized protein involved in copper resistance
MKMKKLTKLTLIILPVVALSFSANAHDPKLHVKKAQKADCSKLAHSKMNMKDPVAIAMMKKCMKQAEKANAKPKDGMDHSKLNMQQEDEKHNH